MKNLKIKFLLNMLLVLFVGKAQAYEWTDENGVTWEFSRKNFTIDGESQNLWYIYRVSGYGETPTIPSVVYNGSTPCVIEALFPSDYSFLNLSCVNSVVVPPTIKYIGKTEHFASYPFQSVVGTVTFQGETPPIIESADVFNKGTTIIVPDASLSAYRQANVWSDIAVRIISQNAQTSYTITTTAQAESSGILNEIGESLLGNVMSLKVTGSINSYDIMIMRNRMYNLHYVDLTDANIVASSFNYADGYHTSTNVLGDYTFREQGKYISVKLPRSLETIGSCAFYSCEGLKEVVLQGNLKTISSEAFESCIRLQNVTLNDGLESIGNNAFYNCKSLTEIQLPSSLKELGSAFGSTGLTSITIPEGITAIAGGTFMNCKSLTNVSLPSTIKTIGACAFDRCTILASFDFPEQLTTIEQGVFSDCPSLTSVNLPQKVTTIGAYAFQNCTGLTEVYLHSAIRSLGDYTFSGCNNLTDVYAFPLEPLTITDNSFSTWTTSTLHVSRQAYNKYLYNNKWNKFHEIVVYDQLKWMYFYTTTDFTITNEISTASDETPDADIDGGSGIIVETTNSTVTLGDVHMADNGTVSASIVANDNLTVENLYFDMAVAANKWYFLSLPFRVKMENVTTPGDYIFRFYDGAARAANGNGGWKNYEGEYLEAHTGYIFQTNTAGTLSFQVDPADVSFSGATRQNAMATHVATNTNNASWNFMGNPFPCYYDIDDTGYEAPITVWNGSSYTAVRPGDDQYHIGPFQAFFVQKPEQQASMSFPFSGCHTNNQWADRVAAKTSANASRRAANSNRRIINLTIGQDENVDDRTRVVFNDAKSTDYELDCDAAKFLSTEPVAQLYTIDGQQTCYAINERPLGEVALGYVAAQAGILTIKAERMDQPVLLYDKQMNITHDLSTGGYTFSSKEGTCDDRFVLTYYQQGTTTINSVNGDPQQSVEMYTIGGRQIGNKDATGTYMVKEGKRTKKIIVK